jgi:hypothetical protein
MDAINNMLRRVKRIIDKNNMKKERRQGGNQS